MISITIPARFLWPSQAYFKFIWNGVAPRLAKKKRTTKNKGEGIPLPIVPAY